MPRPPTTPPPSSTPESPDGRDRRGLLSGLGAYLLLVLANFAFFWPIWTAQVIPYDHWRYRMWLPSWV